MEWTWHRDDGWDGGESYYLCRRGMGELARLCVPELHIKDPRAVERNREVPLRWEWAVLQGIPILMLSGVAEAFDAGVPPIAWLTPFGDYVWEMLQGVELPPLDDGPIWFAFPAIPAAIPPRPPIEW